MTSETDEIALGLPPRQTYQLTRFLVLRALGAVYLVAFVSLAQQIAPLVGDDGLLPARQAFARMASPWWEAPSIFLVLGTSDTTLVLSAWVGVVLATLVTLGATNTLLTTALWALHVSFVHVGRTFWGFGWEMLLAETGFLAMFLCPLRSVEPFPRAPASPVVIVLFRWVVFRLMFGAGLIKMRGDPCWRDLTCLDFHFETQPLPSPLSPLFHFAPSWTHRVGVVFNHVVELVVPFGLFGPRRVRLVAGLATIAFQLTLIASGNLSFLNWLTMAATLACFDDGQLARVLPKRWRSTATREPGRLDRSVPIALAIVVALLSVDPALNLLSPEQAMNASFEPFHLVNTYGAFGSVERVRHELAIEGSMASDPHDDGAYRAYELPCQPSDPTRRPCFVAPYPLRLDWQIWFAAMGSRAEESPWLVHLVAQILEGDADVLGLFSRVPFEEPPRWVRIRRFRYRFAERGAAWWTRDLDDPGFMRPIARDDAALRAYVRRAGWAMRSR